MPYKDPEQHKAHYATQRADHREELRVYNATYRAEHPDRVQAYNATWYVAHRAQHRAYQVQYRREHPEVQRTHMTNYRHRRRANGGSFSRAAWEHLKALFGHCCAYCGRRLKQLTQDHIIPISKGGWHASFNIVPACRSCNSRKGAQLV